MVRCQVERFLEMRAMNAPQQKQQQQFPGGMNHGGFPPVGGGMRTMGYPSLGPDTALGNLSQGVSLGALHGVGGGRWDLWVEWEQLVPPESVHCMDARCREALFLFLCAWTCLIRFVAPLVLCVLFLLESSPLFVVT